MKAMAKKLITKAEYYYVLFTDRQFHHRYKHIHGTSRSLINNNVYTVLLAEKVGISFHVDGNQRLFANIPLFDVACVKFILDKQECFQLLREQFIHRNGYNFVFNKPVVVIDIGMNVGDTALFFAANPFVEKVYAYELMPQIYDRAIMNFEFNPEITDKISPNCYGLGKNDQELTLSYFDNFDLGNGTFNDKRGAMFKEGTLTVCKIKNALTELEKIAKKHSKTALYLKIDAEGAEYEIIDMILTSTAICNLVYIAIEYHFGIQNIVKLLQASHFEIIESFLTIDGDVNNKVGSIQAVRHCIDIGENV